MRPTQKAAVALIIAAIIHAAGGIVGQVVQASTDVSDDLFRYPWSRDAFVVLSAIEAVAFGLGVAGLAGLRTSGVAGRTRAARIGVGVALAGTALFVVAELASIAARDQRLDEAVASALGGLFGLATLLLGAGLAAAGVAAHHARARADRPDAVERDGHGAAAARNRRRAPDAPDAGGGRRPARRHDRLDRAALTTTRRGRPRPPRGAAPAGPTAESDEPAKRITVVGIPRSADGKAPSRGR
jgi:hypothetical protein